MELRCIDCDVSSYDTSGYITYHLNGIEKYTCETCSIKNDTTGEV